MRHCLGDALRRIKRRDGKILKTIEVLKYRDGANVLKIDKTTGNYVKNFQSELLHSPPQTPIFLYGTTISKGTATATLAALINTLKIVGKDMGDIKNFNHRCRCSKCSNN